VDQVLQRRIGPGSAQEQEVGELLLLCVKQAPQKAPSSLALETKLGRSLCHVRDAR